MFKKLVLLLCLPLLLAGCLNENSEVTPEDQASSSQALASKPAEEPLSSSEGEEAAVFAPDHPLTAKETVEAYFKQQYNAYTNLKYIDLSALVDTSEVRNRNALIWLQTLIQRRQLIAENDLCYVETEQYPYTVNYQEQPEDDRMDFWKERGLGGDDELTLHFTITGEKGRAYPPMMAMNAQHTMRLKQIDGEWKITFHYFPGSVRRFFQSGALAIPSKEEMLKDLTEEFAPAGEAAVDVAAELPSGAAPFNGARTAEYAEACTETPNPAFYDIGDWMGNCANFISQCVWYGFGSDSIPNIILENNMTDEWFAGKGGGSPAWENVGHFWDFATADRKAGTKGMHGEVVQGISQLKLGGVIQVRTGRFHQSEESFNHSLVLVDAETLKLAQNSPDCFVYYSDLVNVDTRFFNPQYFID